MKKITNLCIIGGVATATLQSSFGQVGILNGSFEEPGFKEGKEVLSELSTTAILFNSSGLSPSQWDSTFSAFYLRGANGVTALTYAHSLSDEKSVFSQKFTVGKDVKKASIAFDSFILNTKSGGESKFTVRVENVATGSFFTESFKETHDGVATSRLLTTGSLEGGQDYVVSFRGEGGWTGIDDVKVAAVPEPSQTLLGFIGLGAMALRRRR